jgi:hypothetical protein
MSNVSSVEPAALAALRRILLAVVLVGIAGLGAELFLLEHYDGVWQWVPIVALGIGLALGVAVMVAFLVAGAAGVYLHLAGNAEFERESDPAIQGTALLWEALRGATPSLAPGALAQLGLVGLALAYGHPALRRPNR